MAAIDRITPVQIEASGVTFRMWMAYLLYYQWDILGSGTWECHAALGMETIIDIVRFSLACFQFIRTFVPTMNDVFENP